MFRLRLRLSETLQPSPTLLRIVLWYMLISQLQPFLSRI